MVLLDPASLLDETELPVQGDRGFVMREDAEAELVQAAFSRPFDRGGQQERADAATTPVTGHGHADLAVAVSAGVDVDRADQCPSCLRDEVAVEPPGRRPRVDVDRLV